MIAQEKIIEYYDVAEVSYKDVWHLDSALSMHYGFWEKGVNNLKAALIKEMEVLANIVEISKDDIVLDAGCGVGGSSIYMAEHFGCQVYGITLSEQQVKKASTAATQRNVNHLANFQKADFHQTPFEDNSFDVIWFLESFCHSDDFQTLVKEVYRILKPNGRIIIADGFSSKPAFSKKEKSTMDNWLNNWAIDHLATSQSVLDALKNTKFSNIAMEDYTQKIKKSAFIMYFYCQAALFIGWLYKLVGKKYGNEVTIKNTIGGKYQYLALKNKLWEYSVITAVKK